MISLNSGNLESEIAEATKRYMQQEWSLDVSTFKCTPNSAWVHLAGRILGRPGVTMPVKPIANQTKEIVSPRV